MGSYKYIYLASLQIFDNQSGILGRTGTREVIYTYRKTFQSTFKGLVMLISQHGGRHQYSHLLTVASRLKSCSYGNLRLSEANIATNQTIHRSATLHIFLHFSSSFSLIGCIFIKKRCLQFMLQITVSTKGKTLFSSALRI